MLEMRLLADENFPFSLIQALRAGGHDVRWARTDFPGWSDVRLLEFAESESRVILTLDKDFWQIALQRRVPIERSGVVLFRIHPATPEMLMPSIRVFLDANGPWVGHISIVTTDGIQMLAVRKE